MSESSAGATSRNWLRSTVSLRASQLSAWRLARRPICVSELVGLLAGKLDSSQRGRERGERAYGGKKAVKLCLVESIRVLEGGGSLDKQEKLGLSRRTD